jgi:hypothetical protein
LKISESTQLRSSKSGIKILPASYESVESRDFVPGTLGVNVFTPTIEVPGTSLGRSVWSVIKAPARRRWETGKGSFLRDASEGVGFQ